MQKKEARRKLGPLFVLPIRVRLEVERESAALISKTCALWVFAAANAGEPNSDVNSVAKAFDTPLSLQNTYVSSAPNRSVTRREGVVISPSSRC